VNSVLLNLDHVDQVDCFARAEEAVRQKKPRRLFPALFFASHQYLPHLPRKPIREMHIDSRGMLLRIEHGKGRRDRGRTCAKRIRRLPAYARRKTKSIPDGGVTR